MKDNFCVIVGYCPYCENNPFSVAYRPGGFTFEKDGYAVNFGCPHLTLARIGFTKAFKRLDEATQEYVITEMEGDNEPQFSYWWSSRVEAIWPENFHPKNSPHDSRPAHKRETLDKLMLGYFGASPEQQAVIISTPHEHQRQQFGIPERDPELVRGEYGQYVRSEQPKFGRTSAIFARRPDEFLIQLRDACQAHVAPAAA